MYTITFPEGRGSSTFLFALMGQKYPEGEVVFLPNFEKYLPRVLFKTKDRV